MYPYHPWALFPWWYHYDAYAPHVFDRAGMFAGASGFVGCAAAIFGSLWRARQSSNVTTYGSARWASRREIERAGLHHDAGVMLGTLRGRYLRHDGPEHVMAFAPTRSGKGVGLVVPTLLSWTGSAVVHDIKGENWTLTAGWRARFSHCLLFNPTDATSAHYNPLLEVRRGVDEVRDVQNIADVLVDPEGALESRNHWEKTSHSLLVGAILHILYAEEEKTLARVATFLSDPQRSFVATLRRMMTTNHLGDDKNPKVHPVVASAARELLNKSENERSGVLSMRRDWLSAYGFVTERGARFLDDYARAADPFARIGERTVSVQVTSVVRASERSFQVKWTETAYERGSEAGSSHWTGILTIVTKPPVSADTLRRNPLGIYVDAIDWSRELEPPASAAPARAATPPGNLPLGSPLDPNLAPQPTVKPETQP